jgi:hydrogenase-4 membrane subunit HyfE
VAGYLAIAVITRIYLNPMHYELLLSTLLVISSVWVSYDAHSKHLPHPLRWGVSALLLWIVVFPWYLSRRRNPQSPCPLMEAEGSVFIRALLWVLLIFFVLSLIAAVVVRKPPH